MKFKLFGLEIYIYKINQKSDMIDPFDGPIQRQSRNYHLNDNLDIDLVSRAYRERQNLIEKRYDSNRNFK